MGHTEDVFVSIMPWAGLQQEIKIGNARFWPWEGTKAGMIDGATKDTVQRYLDCFVDDLGDAVKTVAVCSYEGKEFRCLTDSEMSEMRCARDALVFCVICPQVVQSIRGCSVGLCSAERFQVVGQQLEKGRTTLYVVSGHNTTLGQFKIHKPLAVSSGYLAQPEFPLIKAFDKVLGAGFPEGLRRRLFRSLEWFRLAHVEADQVSEQSRVVMMATAFETLLDIPAQTTDKSMFFADEVEKKFAIQESVCDSRVYKKEVHTRSRAAWWAYDYYKLRNKIVHGDDVCPADTRYGSHVGQKDVADLVLHSILFQVLCENDCVDYPPSMSRLTPEERADVLLCYEGFEEAQQILGWLQKQDTEGVEHAS